MNMTSLGPEMFGGPEENYENPAIRMTGKMT
jgi:hypothetical protein